MRFTKLRFIALQAADAGKDYPGTVSVRRTLEKEGAISWNGMPTCYQKHGSLDRSFYGENFLYWRITDKGKTILNEWKHL